MLTFTDILLIIAIGFLVINSIIGILNFIASRNINSTIDEVKDFKKQISGTASKITDTHRIVNNIIGFVRDLANRPAFVPPQRFNNNNGYRGDNRNGGYRGNNDRNGPNGYRDNRGYRDNNRRYDNSRPRYGDDTGRVGPDDGSTRNFERTSSSRYIPDDGVIPDGKSSRDMISDLTGDNLGKRKTGDLSHLATTIEDHSDDVNFEDFHDDGFDDREDAVEPGTAAEEQIRGDISDEEFTEDTTEK